MFSACVEIMPVVLVSRPTPPPISDIIRPTPRAKVMAPRIVDRKNSDKALVMNVEIIN